MEYYLELFQFNAHQHKEKDTIDICMLFKPANEVDLIVHVDKRRRFAAILVQEYTQTESELTNQTLFLIDAHRFDREKLENVVASRLSVSGISYSDRQLQSGIMDNGILTVNHAHLPPSLDEVSEIRPKSTHMLFTLDR